MNNLQALLSDSVVSCGPPRHLAQPISITPSPLTDATLKKKFRACRKNICVVIQPASRNFHSTNSSEAVCSDLGGDGMAHQSNLEAIATHAQSSCHTVY